MPDVARRTREIDGLDPERIPFAELLESQRPAILKGVVKDWEIARRGAQSNASSLRRHWPAATSKTTQESNGSE